MGRARKAFAGPSPFSTDGKRQVLPLPVYFSTSFQEFVANFPVRRHVSGGGFLSKENNLTTCRKDKLFTPCPCHLYRCFAPLLRYSPPCSVGFSLFRTEFPLFLPTHFSCPPAKKIPVSLLQMVPPHIFLKKFLQTLDL